MFAIIFYILQAGVCTSILVKRENYHCEMDNVQLLHAFSATVMPLRSPKKNPFPLKRDIQSVIMILKLLAR